MKRVMLSYRVKADQAEENERLIKQVFKQLFRQLPEGVQYSVYRQSDGVSFVHIAAFEDRAADQLFAALPAFKDFRAAIRERCDEQPVTVHVEELGAYY
ncbi:antibiotic biosynthesis monooxygenase [uncultured Chitinophaga sp.]|jgi:Antibiotic biosynthesis monooxygenase.|uniref:antibiotic biosynthesis monooxygenase n=1 Tax=uncultured Chitinophaga sp. TaxID=339340 RepID=UPI002603BD46|nr:antibiotic biosynthesis monooxygenase [uncultured Chitinophaga sp.]